MRTDVVTRALRCLGAVLIVILIGACADRPDQAEAPRAAYDPGPITPSAA
jgi:hypothetical protein